MNEARKKYLWSINGLPRTGEWQDANVAAVVLGWTVRGYVEVQKIPFVARDAAHAQEVALAAYQLWCIAHGEDVGNAQPTTT